MASGNAILAGILGGLGNAGLIIGGGFEQQQKEQVRREELRQQAAESALRNALLNKQIDQQQAQHEATQAAAERDKYVQPSDIAAMYAHLGLKPPSDTMGPSNARIPAAWALPMFTQAAEQQKRTREEAARMAQAGVLERLGAGSPGAPAVEPPDEGAMYSAGTPETPATAANPKYQAIAGLLRQGPLAEYLIKALDTEADKGIATDKPIYKNGQWIMPPAAPPRDPFMPPQNSRPVPTVGEDGKVSTRYEPEPRQHELARRALADKGWQPGMKGYDAAFYDAVSALTPVTEGGGAATRSQGIPSPDGRAPAQTPTVITGPQKPVGGEVARSIAGAEMASQAVQRLVRASQDPAVQNYLGPYDQYRSDAQRRAPQAALGEVPMEVVDLDQDIATTKNYLLNLRSGAAVTPQEGDRMEKELMKKSSRGPVFQREVENTARNVQQLEQRVKELALRGDQRALAVAEQYGLLSATPRATSAPPGAGQNQLSRQDPLYSHARSRGMTDQQIQSKYGITLVP
jgi:hypothetical protein